MSIYKTGNTFTPYLILFIEIEPHRQQHHH